MESINFPVAIMYVATLATGVGIWWLRESTVKQSYRKELDEFRAEMNQLAATIGLMKRGPQIPKPPNFGGNT